MIFLTEYLEPSDSFFSIELAEPYKQRPMFSTPAFFVPDRRPSKEIGGGFPGIFSLRRSRSAIPIYMEARGRLLEYPAAVSAVEARQFPIALPGLRCLQFLVIRESVGGPVSGNG